MATRQSFPFQYSKFLKNVPKEILRLRFQANLSDNHIDTRLQKAIVDKAQLVVINLPQKQRRLLILGSDKEKKFQYFKTLSIELQQNSFSVQ